MFMIYIDYPSAKEEQPENPGNTRPLSKLGFIGQSLLQPLIAFFRTGFGHTFIVFQRPLLKRTAEETAIMEKATVIAVKTPSGPHSSS